MDETTTAPGSAGPAPRIRRGRRKWQITVLAVGVLAAALGWNTVSVRAETAAADGAQIMRFPDGDLRVVRAGPPDAPTVVLVHGLAGSTTWWDPVVPALPNLHVVRIDLLGHGRSAKPADGYRIPEQARRIGAVLDQIGVRRATIVGHSTGGAVATSLAEQRRELVSAIVAIDTGPRADAFLGDSFVARLLTTPVVGELIWRLRTDGTIRKALSTAFTREVQVPEQIIADIRGMTYRSLTAAGEASDSYLGQRPIPDRLADVGLPTLVIFGSRDRRWQPASAQDYRRIPNARIEILDGVGHSPMIEAPDTTAALLRGFVGEIRG